MKLPSIVCFAAVLVLCGCVVTGPAISKGTTGNLEINVSAPQGMEVRSARVFVDDVFIGNVSERMPVLFLKRGMRTVRVELPGTQMYQQSVRILGDPNHQVLNITLEKITSNEPAQGQEARIAKTNKPSLRLDLTTEDARPAKIKIEIKNSEARPKVIRKMEDVSSGSAELALSGVPDADYLVYFSSPGYAAQWQPLTVKQGRAEPGKMLITLFRQRYVVLRYAFNTSGGRVLSGRSVIEGRAAVAHWGGLPYFQQDWQVWQKSLGTNLFGNTPYLEFHRFSKGFGFAVAPKGVAFDDLKEAPAKTEYRCENMKAEKGLTLFCRVQNNDNGVLGYGKVVVEDVTETPPAGVKVINAP